MESRINCVLLPANVTFSILPSNPNSSFKASISRALTSGSSIRNRRSVPVISGAGGAATSSGAIDLKAFAGQRRQTHAGRRIVFQRIFGKQSAAPLRPKFSRLRFLRRPCLKSRKISPSGEGFFRERVRGVANSTAHSRDGGIAIGTRGEQIRGGGFSSGSKSAPSSLARFSRPRRFPFSRTGSTILRRNPVRRSPCQSDSRLPSDDGAQSAAPA